MLPGVLTISNLPAAVEPRIQLPIRSADVLQIVATDRTQTTAMDATHPRSTHALMEGSDLAGAEKSQRSETARWRVAASDDRTPKVRNRNHRRNRGEAPD